MVDYPAKSHYRGEAALRYEQRRKDHRQWSQERAALQNITKGFGAGSSILDVPFGTGRFLDHYKTRGFIVFGADISADMLSQTKAQQHFSPTTRLIVGDAESLPIKNNTFDYVVCIRLFNWMRQPVIESILSEYARICRKGMVIGIRLGISMTPLRSLLLLRNFLPPWRPFPLRRIVTHIKNIVTNPAIFLKARKPLDGYVLHHKDDVLDLFDRMHMEIAREIVVNARASITARTIKPYMIYLLRPKTVHDGPSVSAQRHDTNRCAKKIYLISSPCSGKTTFFKKTRGIYRGMGLFDFEDIVRQWTEKSGVGQNEIMAMPLEERLNFYNKLILSFMRDYPGSVCVLGTMGPPHPHTYQGIRFAAVIPPRQRAQQCCRNRIETLERNRNGQHRWCVWENIETFRQNIASYAGDNRLPVYSDFPVALDRLLKT